MKEKLIPRNLVKLGANSLVITLPKNWLEKNKLEKGDIVYMNQKENTILISSTNKIQEQEKEIIIDYKNKTLKELKSELTTAYMDGYDIIKINKQKLKVIPGKIKFMIHDLVGLEIVQQTANFIIARELLDLEKTQIKNITRRIDYIVRGMLDDLLKCDKEDDYLNIFDRDFDVNRLTFLVFRTINKSLTNNSYQQSLKMSIKELMDYKMLVFNLERIGDNVKRLAKIKCMFNAASVKSVELMKEFADLYLETLEVFYKNDRKKAYKIALENDDRIIKCKEFLHNNQTYLNSELVHLLQNISKELRDIARLTCSRY